MASFNFTGIFMVMFILVIPIAILFIYTKFRTGISEEVTKKAEINHAREMKEMDMWERKEERLAAQKEKELEQERQAESREEMIEEFVIKEEMKKGQIVGAMKERVEIIANYGTGAKDQQYGQPILNVLLGFANQLSKLTQDEAQRVDQIFKLEAFKEKLEHAEERQTKMQEKLQKAEIKGSKKEFRDLEAMKKKSGAKNKGFITKIEAIEKQVKKLKIQKDKFEKKEIKDEKKEEKDTKNAEKHIQEWEKELQESLKELNDFMETIKSGNTDAGKIKADAKAFKDAFKKTAIAEKAVFTAQKKELEDRINEINDMIKVETLENKIARLNEGMEIQIARYDASVGKKDAAAQEKHEKDIEEGLAKASANEARKLLRERNEALKEKHKLEADEKMAGNFSLIFD